MSQEHMTDLKGWALYRRHLFTLGKATLYAIPIIAFGMACERFVRADAGLEDELRKQRVLDYSRPMHDAKTIRDFVLANAKSDLPAWDIRFPSEIPADRLNKNPVMNHNDTPSK